MKFSVVTISFNQAQFLSKTILSVLAQREDGIEVEYIVVDPGSTDGSREIINSFRDNIDHIIYEPDAGPADGLNRGFALATGDVFHYLNSDDTLERGAFRKARDWMETHPEVDVACGHAWAIDGKDKRLRRVWSEPYSRLPVAYGESVQIQPSTFIRREAFERTGGFNIENRSNWDGELLIDLYQSGASFALVNTFLSNYRLHETSITNSGKLISALELWNRRKFLRLMGREPNGLQDRIAGFFWRIVKHARNPVASYERLAKGPMFQRGVK